jgi:hypothetical protein
MNKTYIGKVEAYEFMLENNLSHLPRKNGNTWLIVPAIATMLPDIRFGKNEQGYYLETVNV